MHGVGVGVGLGGGPDCAQYLPPVLVTKLRLASNPPHTIIISLPVHTAVSPDLADGAYTVLVAVQLSMLGLYLPPVFKSPMSPAPPQTIILLPVQTTDETPTIGRDIMLVVIQLSKYGLYFPPVLKH